MATVLECSGSGILLNFGFVDAEPFLFLFTPLTLAAPNRDYNVWLRLLKFFDVRDVASSRVGRYLVRRQPSYRLPQERVSRQRSLETTGESRRERNDQINHTIIFKLKYRHTLPHAITLCLSRRFVWCCLPFSAFSHTCQTGRLCVNKYVSRL